MWFKSSHSKHLVIMGASDTGHLLFVADILGIGMIVADFRQAEMMACVRESLKIVVKSCES